jgi:hypothetical protein
MRVFQVKRVTDLSNERGIAKRMADAVELCRDHSYWVPALVLATAGIDRLAGIRKTDKAQKIAYMKLLKREFPDLCKQISPNEFYSKIRSGLVHGYSPSKGYGLANAQEMDGEYVAEFPLRGTRKKFRALNVDRFIRDFVALARRRAA